MMHKLGMFKLRINYGVKAVSDFLFHHEMSTLGCLIDSHDENNASRYYESYQCRMVAETVLRTTFSSMMVHEDLDAAMMQAMQSLTYNALNMSLLPVLHERFIQRVIQYEPLLGMSTLGLMLKVPVVSVKSVLELMNGKPVTDQDDAHAMRQYVLHCIEGRNSLLMLPYVGMDEYSNPDGKLQGYVSCTLLKQTCTSNPSGSGMGSMGGRSSGNGGAQGSAAAGGGSSSLFSSTAPNGVPMEPIGQIISRIFNTDQKILTNCAFIKDLLGFQRCVLSLMKAFDLRDFFGGMSCYHNGEAMARALQIPNPGRFSNRFMNDSLDGSRADPVMLPSKIHMPGSNDMDYFVGIRVWDALLWFAILGRPRRDVGIMADFAKTLAQYCMQLLPRSVFPYSMVPMTRLDPIEKKQVIMDFQQGTEPRPLNVVRATNSGILTRNFKLECEGKISTKVLEDECYMSEIFEMAEDIELHRWKDIPLCELAGSLDIHWEYGVCYPVGR